MTSIECNCDAPDLEYTLVKDELSGLILLQCYCNNCKRSASGYGRSVQQALMEVRRKWKKGIRSHHKK